MPSDVSFFESRRPDTNNSAYQAYMAGKRPRCDETQANPPSREQHVKRGRTEAPDGDTVAVSSNPPTQLGSEAVVRNYPPPVRTALRDQTPLTHEQPRSPSPAPQITTFLPSAPVNAPVRSNSGGLRAAYSVQIQPAAASMAPPLSYSQPLSALPSPHISTPQPSARAVAPKKSNPGGRSLLWWVLWLCLGSGFVLLLCFCIGFEGSSSSGNSEQGGNSGNSKQGGRSENSEPRSHSDPCSPGWTRKVGSTILGPNEPCRRCPPDTYKPVSGDGACSDCPVHRGTVVSRLKTACKPCAAGEFATSAGCKPCPEGSWAQESSAVCTCLPGWTRTEQGGKKRSTESACFLCPANTYKAVNGSVACLSCPSDWTSPEGSTQITDCVPGITGAVWSMLSALSPSTKNVQTKEELWGKRKREQIASFFQDSLVSISEGADGVLSWVSKAPSVLMAMLDALCGDIFGSLVLWQQAAKDAGEGSNSFGGCQFRDSSHAISSIKATRLWKEYQSAAASAIRYPGKEACDRAKTAAKPLLLKIHPDKFNAAHPDCGPNLSLSSVKELNALNQVVKGKCLEFRR